MTLFYADAKAVRVPVNYRVVDKKERKTKNDLFGVGYEAAARAGVPDHFANGCKSLSPRAAVLARGLAAARDDRLPVANFQRRPPWAHATI